MKLEVHKHRIERVDFGKKTKILEHTLYIHKEELINAISEVPGVMVDAALCRPGENVRITNILDIVEPRAKPEGRGDIFPGFLGSLEKVGNGITKVLEGVAVVEVGSIPRVQEGLIDMKGQGARYSHFSQTNNIVLVFVPAEGTDIPQFEQKVRLAGLKAGTYLAGASLEIEPDDMETFELGPHADSKKGKGLKRMAYIYMLQSQGFLRNTFFYGQSVGELSPTLIHPNEVMDGSIVSGNYVIPSNRNPTYFHLNNPVIKELYGRHGKDLLFSGVVICNEHSRLGDKERTAHEAVEIIGRLGADGVIITKEGGGNADTDLMLMCQACESRGIRTVLIGNEGAGPDGKDPSLAHITSEANAFVTAGNNDETIELEPVERLIGFGTLPGTPEDLKERLIIPVSRIHGATNLLGFGMLTSTFH